MSSITRIRNKNFDKWFTINLAIHDLPADVLSPEGKAFHTYLASKPDEWEYNRDHAITIIGSGYKIDKAIAELKALGLLTVERVKVNGRFAGYDWQIEVNLPAPKSDNQEPVPKCEYQDPDIQGPVIHRPLEEIPKEEEKPSSEKLPSGAREPRPETLPGLDIETAKPEGAAKATRSRKPKDPAVPKHDPGGFAEVCAQYPGTVDAVKSARQWDKLKPDNALKGELLHHIAERKAGGDWATQDPFYITHLHNFLKDQGWKVQWRKPGAPPPIPRRTASAAERMQSDLDALLNA